MFSVSFFSTTVGGVTKTIYAVHGCPTPRDKAIEICEKLIADGTLWQPESEEEYNAFFTAIGYNAGTEEPDWYWNNPDPHFWIGFTYSSGSKYNNALSNYLIDFTCTTTNSYKIFEWLSGLARR